MAKTSSKSIPVEVEQENSSDGEDIPPPAFTKQFVILKNIFEKLPAVDLLSCERVCKIWSDVAGNVRRHRKNFPYSIVFHPYIPHTEEAIEYFIFKNHNRYKISPDIITFMESCVDYGYPDTDDLLGEVELEDFVSKMNMCIKNSVKNSLSETQMVVSFGSMSLNLYVHNQENLDDMVGGLVPNVGSIGYGVITTTPDLLKSFETEHDSLPILSCLAIPKIPGFYIKDCTIDKSRIMSLGKATTSNCEDILQISPEDNVKGIIIMSHTYNRDYYKSAILKAIYFYLQKNPNVALGGGEQHQILSPQLDKKNRVLAKILLICGDENVKVASLAMQDRKLSKKNETCLQKVKDANFEEKCSFAFMFACNGRGFEMHRKPHVESTLFRKYFPHTLIAGSFTGGEFFHEYVPGYESKAPEKSSRLEYSFTTVFVLVSCKQPNNVLTH